MFEKTKINEKEAGLELNYAQRITNPFDRGMHKISQKLYHICAKFKNQRMIERDVEKTADLTLDRI